MKKIFSKFIALSSIGLLLLPACKKSGELVTSNGGKAGALTASATTLVLDKTKLNDPSAVINFSFTAPDYGFSAAVNNTLQIDIPSDNWQHPTSATLSTKVYAQGYSTAVFNNLLLKLNVPAGVATPVVVRVMHSVSAQVPPIYSNVLDMTVTCFNLTSYVYVPGSYEGWANPGPLEDSLVSVTGNGIYIGIINFPAGSPDFLVLPVKGDWSHKYATTAGATSGATAASYPVQLVTGGDNNFFAPSTAGNYIVTLDVNANTLTLQQADYYSIIGSATPGGNWSTDLWLKFINDGNNNWVGSFTLLAGQFKFRQDGQWSNSWGDVSPADGVHATDSNGGNINATAGAHTVTFTMAPSAYGSPAQTLATYNLK
jgi:hypothetical protein